MSRDREYAACPDCGRTAAILSPSRLAGHTDYSKSTYGQFPRCTQKTDPTAAIAAARLAWKRRGLARDVGNARERAENMQKRYDEVKSWHDDAQATLAAAEEALAAFDRAHPPAKTNDETADAVRATATFPRTGEGDDA